MIHRQPFHLLALFCTLCLLILTTPALFSGPADSIVGNGQASSCTEAALDAALADGGTITFACGPAATIVFTAQKQVTKAIVLDGADKITLSGGNSTSLFWVQATGHLTLHNLTLTNGSNASGAGGALRNQGTTIIRSSTIRDSQTTGTEQGGALANESGAILDIADSVIVANKSANAGGLYNSGILTITNSSIRQNQALVSGGGLYNEGTATLISVALAQNKANFGGGIDNTGSLVGANVVANDNEAGDGGGLYNEGTAVMVNATIFVRNQARYGGGIYNDAVLTLIDATLGDNEATIGGGGGILSSDDSVLNLFNSTVNDNTAVRGGGVLISGAASLINVTLSSNAADDGGGIYSAGSGTLAYVTLSGNSALVKGGGIHHNAGKTLSGLSLRNTVIAGSSHGGACYVEPESVSILTSDGTNLADDGTCAPYFTQPSDRNSVTLQLGPLADYGGRTLTHQPQPASPAVNGGQCIAEIGGDQRGVGRPQGPKCDAGSVEYTAQQPPPYLQVTPTGFPTSIPTPSFFITPEPKPDTTPTIPATPEGMYLPSIRK